MKLLPLAALALLFGGCRSKSYESFVAATTPQGEVTGQGNPYTYGGTAYASGGQNAKTQYGQGARQTAQPEVGYDDPAKGSGLQPGDEPASGRPWWATQNAPVSQARPGAIDANGTRVRN